MPSLTLADQIAVFRHFNRMYTRFIRTLQEGLLNTQYSLAEARVLYELGTRTAPKAKEIAQELGLDPGFLSRLLNKLESSGLLTRKASEHDARSSDLALTSTGKREFRKLNALSDKQAGAILKELSEPGRSQLVVSMRTIETVLDREERKRKAAYILRPHRVGDMGWVVARESAIYAEEFGWDASFECLVARIVADFLANFQEKRERCWIADLDGESVGHIFLVQHPEEPDTAKLRLLFVEPRARGLGLGQVLVEECLRFARAAGYNKVVLWTQSILIGAHRIYEKAGFRLIGEEPHCSFGKDLIGQTWQLTLSRPLKANNLFD